MTHHHCHPHPHLGTCSSIVAFHPSSRLRLVLGGTPFDCHNIPYVHCCDGQRNRIAVHVGGPNTKENHGQTRMGKGSTPTTNALDGGQSSMH
jgi:hypothetical protein